MKKFCLFITIFIIAVKPVCAQSGENSIPQIDNIINVLSRDIHRKLVEERATAVAVSKQFTFRGDIPPFASYWVNQLTEVLANIPNRPYILLSDGLVGAEFRISGEIVETAGIIRVYSRLIRQDNRAIVASFTSDLERNAAITALLSSSSRYIPLDDYEPDSWDNPVSFEIGTTENITSMSRTINDNDEDFFLLLPNNDGRLVMETISDIDTYMEFYDAGNRRLLAEDDDSGQDNNARIVYNVESGKRYIAKVRGYNDEVTGYYAFRAYFRTLRAADNSWENPIQYQLGTNQNALEISRTLFEEDADFFFLVPNSTGRLVMETTGDTDTYMEFYNADTKQLLDENDDGSQGNNARIIYNNIEAGKRYIAKVRGYNSETAGDYVFRAYILPPKVGANSWENPLQYQLGTNQNATVANRILSEFDADFFLLVPSRNGVMVIETTGDTDTYMELYEADTKRLLADDDDSGEEYNALITYNVEARKRYIVKVRSYGDSGGSYGFKAFIRR
jgi:hypothetical protein